jgi:predicted metal-dependent hydrolase
LRAVPEIAYAIRRSQRARRVRVNADPEDGVEVVLPRRARPEEAAAAIRELRPWIERRLRDFERARWAVRPREDAVPYLGRMLELVPERGRQRVAQRGERLLVPAGDPRPALERWYRRQARAELATRLDRACSLAGSSYRSLSIRGQRTRWASCGSSGAMSFNWRLLLAPEAVVDAVVWHEVCHLEVPDHSTRFWALLERRCTDYREHQRWLRRYGSALAL